MITTRRRRRGWPTDRPRIREASSPQPVELADTRSQLSIARDVDALLCEITTF